MKCSVISRLAVVSMFLLIVSAVPANKTPDSPVCESNDDCEYPFASCIDQFCIHKDVFPIEWQEILGAGIIFVAISLGNAVGIGGGAIIVTVGTSLFFFTIKQSVAVASMTIFFAMISGYLQNFSAKHPLKDATLVDYGIVQCQMPLIALGVFIGTEVSEILPGTAIFILLVLTLVFATLQTFQLAIETTRKERRVVEERKEISVNRRVKAMLRKQQRDGADTGEEYPDVTTPLNNGEVPDHARDSYVSQRTEVEEIEIDGEVIRPVITYENDEIADNDLVHLIGAKKAVYAPEEMNPIIEGMLAGERDHLTMDKGILVLVPWGAILMISLFRGSAEFKRAIGAERCNFMDFFLVALTAIVLIFFGTINIMLLKRDFRAKKAYGYKFVRGDLKWNNETITAFASLALVGGIVAGLVGLSSEVLFTPFYIRFGAPPSVAGVTSQFLGIFASLGALTVYAANGYLLWGFGFWLGTFGAVATLIGSYSVGGIIGRYNKTSIPVLIIAFLVLASLIAEASTGTVRTVRAHNRGENIWAIPHYCDPN